MENKKIYHRIKLKSEELFNRAEEWLLSNTSTYQFTSRGLAQYSIGGGVIVKSSPRSKSVYIISADNGIVNHLEKRLNEAIN
jgi:hypothetical protein